METLSSVLKIGVIAEPPYAYDCFFENQLIPYKDRCLNPGYGIEMSILICEILNLTCSFEKVNHTLYGSLDSNGSWIGMIRQVMDG